MGLVNLSRRKARTILTALSMAIGVMCIVVLISVGLGYEAAYRENIEAMGSLTKIDVTPPSDSTGGRTALLNDKAVDAFKKLRGVEAVTPVVQATAWLQSGSYIGSAKLYGIDLSTAESFLIYPVEGEMPGAGTHLRPEIMFTDDMAASFADPDKDWEFALNADGTPKVDILHSTVKLTFDYSNLSGEYQEGSDGRAVSAGNMYRLFVPRRTTPTRQAVSWTERDWKNGSARTARSFRSGLWKTPAGRRLMISCGSKPRRATTCRRLQRSSETRDSRRTA